MSFQQRPVPPVRYAREAALQESAWPAREAATLRRLTSHLFATGPHPRAGLHPVPRSGYLVDLEPGGADTIDVDEPVELSLFRYSELAAGSREPAVVFLAQLLATGMWEIHRFLRTEPGLEYGPGPDGCSRATWSELAFNTWDDLVWELDDLSVPTRRHFQRAGVRHVRQLVAPLPHDWAAIEALPAPGLDELGACLARRGWTLPRRPLHLGGRHRSTSGWAR